MHTRSIPSVEPRKERSFRRSRGSGCPASLGRAGWQNLARRRSAESPAVSKVLIPDRALAPDFRRCHSARVRSRHPSWSHVLLENVLVGSAAMVTLSLESVIVQDEEPVVATVDGEVVMLSARAEAYFGLGEVGTTVWNMIERPCGVDEICDRIVESFDVEREACERDVIWFIDELIDLRLVRLVEGAAEAGEAESAAQCDVGRGCDRVGGRPLGRPFRSCREGCFPGQSVPRSIRNASPIPIFPCWSRGPLRDGRLLAWINAACLLDAARRRR